MQAKTPPFPQDKFEVIYADPPWQYSSRQSSQGRWKKPNGAYDHYPTMPLAELKSLPVPSVMADDCLLFLWAVNPLLDEAIELGKAWGFNWATVAFVWNKGKRNVGFYTLPQCELCLVFKAGKIPQPRGIRNARQYFEGGRRHHSAKPDEIRQRIVEMFPTQKKLEMFARGDYDGWTSWGLDAPSNQDPAQNSENLL